MSDEQIQSEDVEAHNMGHPNMGHPNLGHPAADDGDDVEGHMLGGNSQLQAG